MRYFAAVTAACVIAGTTVPGLAVGQDTDVLAGAGATRFYIETSYEGNEERDACDWYAGYAEFLARLRESRGVASGDCHIDIRLKGTLNQAGARRFAELVAELGRTRLRPAAIVLDSRGGDADAALAIARLIRDEDVFRRIPGGVATRIEASHTAVCFSGCIVIFAAGYRRSAEFNIFGDPDLPSRLGIHGPGQFDRAAGRYDTSPGNRDIQRIRGAFEKFFGSVGVSATLVDDMFAVPFDDIRLLNESELRTFGLLDDRH